MPPKEETLLGESESPTSWDASIFDGRDPLRYWYRLALEGEDTGDSSARRKEAFPPCEGLSSSWAKLTADVPIGGRPGEVGDDREGGCTRIPLLIALAILSSLEGDEGEDAEGGNSSRFTAGEDVDEVLVEAAACVEERLSSEEEEEEEVGGALPREGEEPVPFPTFDRIASRRRDSNVNSAREGDRWAIGG